MATDHTLKSGRLVSIFWGGEERGRCIQLSHRPGTPEGPYDEWDDVVLTAAEIEELAELLKPEAPPPYTHRWCLDASDREVCRDCNVNWPGSDEPCTRRE